MRLNKLSHQLLSPNSRYAFDIPAMRLVLKIACALQHSGEVGQEQEMSEAGLIARAVWEVTHPKLSK